MESLANPIQRLAVYPWLEIPVFGRDPSASWTNRDPYLTSDGRIDTDWAEINLLSFRASLEQDPDVLMTPSARRALRLLHLVARCDDSVGATMII